MIFVCPNFEKFLNTFRVEPLVPEQSMTTIVVEENSNFEEKYYSGILFGLIKLLQNKKLQSVAENFPDQNNIDTSGLLPADLPSAAIKYRSKPVLKVRIYSNELTPLDDMALSDNFQLDGNVHAKIKRQNLILISDFFNVGAEKERFTVAVTLDMRSIFNFHSVECNSVGPLGALGQFHPLNSERVKGSLRNSSFEGSTIDEVNEFLKFINDSFTYSREYKENLALEFNNALDIKTDINQVCSDPSCVESLEPEPLQSIIAGPSGHEFTDFRPDTADCSSQIIETGDTSDIATIPAVHGSLPERPKSLVMWDSTTEYVSSPFESLAQSEKARQVLAYNYNFYILSPIY